MTSLLFLIPILLVQLVLERRVPYLGVATAVAEFVAAVWALAVGPAVSYGASALLVFAVAGILLRVFVVVNESVGARKRPQHKLGKVSPCKCGCVEVDAASARENGLSAASMVDRPFGTYGHVLRVDTGHASQTTVAVHGVEKLDVFEASLQVFCYGTFFAWTALLVLFEGNGDLAAVVNAVAVSVVAASTVHIVHVNMKTQCAYVCPTDSTVHFLLFISNVVAVSASSVYVSTRVFSAPSDAFAYVVLAVALPIALCALSPPVVTDKLDEKADPMQREVQAAEMYLYSWLHFRSSCEAAFWLWAVVLAGAPQAGQELQGNAAEVVRVAFSTTAVTFAFIYASSVISDILA